MAASCLFTGPISQGQASVPVPVNRSVEVPRDEAVASVPSIAAPDVQLVTRIATASPTDEVLAKLNAPLKQVRFDGTPLGEALTWFAQNTKINIYANWKALAGENWHKEALVSIQLSNVPAGKALQLILDDASGGTGRIQFMIDSGVLTISTPADIALLTSRSKQNTFAVVSANEGADSIDQALRGKLAQLESDMARLSQGADSQSPDAVGLRAQIETIKARLSQSAVDNSVRISNDTTPFATVSQSRLSQLMEQLSQLTGPQNLGSQHPKVISLQRLIAQEQVRLQEAQTRQLSVELKIYDVRTLLEVSDSQAGALTSAQQSSLKDLVASMETMIKNPAMSVAGFNGSLVVKAPLEVHRQVIEILNQLEMVHEQRVAQIKERAAQQKLGAN